MNSNLSSIDSGTGPKKNSSLIYWLLGIIAVLFASNIYVYIKKNDTTRQLETQTIQAKDEKSSMQLELNKLESDLAASTNGNQKLTADLQEKDLELKNKISELRKALKDKSISKVELERAREEIKQLRFYIQKYNTDIANLTTVNKKLVNENSQLKTTVDSVTQTTAKLKSDNESLQKKVNAGSALKTVDIKASPFQVKGNGKESSVTKAKRTDKIRITYTLADNDLSAEGPHDVYLQLFDPSGKIESGDNAGNFTSASGDNLQYSSKSTINYLKANKTYTIEWLKKEALPIGNYKVVLYSDGYKMGESTFTLKGGWF